MRPNDSHEQYADLSGRRIRMLVAGNGHRTVVLWPGLGATAESFARLLREGADHGYRMAALDPPGQGLSDRIPLRGRSDAAAVFLAVLGELGAKSAVLGGHSYGAGATLAALAGSRELRERTQGVILYDGGYLPFDDSPADRQRLCESYLSEFTFASWDEFLDLQRREARHWDGDSERAARASMVEQGGRIRLRLGVSQCCEAMELMAGSAPALLAPLDLPAALLLRAGRPPEMESERVAGVEGLRSSIPSLAVRVFPEASHELLDDDPAGVARDTFAFLGGIAWA
jgi:pimeloyl-ACP methyl ester carboxylesterase